MSHTEPLPRGARPSENSSTKVPSFLKTWIRLFIRSQT